MSDLKKQPWNTLASIMRAQHREVYDLAWKYAQGQGDLYDEKGFANPELVRILIARFGPLWSWSVQEEVKSEAAEASVERVQLLIYSHYVRSWTAQLPEGHGVRLRDNFNEWAGRVWHHHPDFSEYASAYLADTSRPVWKVLEQICGYPAGSIYSHEFCRLVVMTRAAAGAPDDAGYWPDQRLPAGTTFCRYVHPEIGKRRRYAKSGSIYSHEFCRLVVMTRAAAGAPDDAGYWPDQRLPAGTTFCRYVHPEIGKRRRYAK